MNDQAFILLMNVLGDEAEHQELRLFRRNLRDASDPLSAPENVFKGLYRLSRNLAHELITDVSPFLPNQQREGIFVPKKLKIMAALHFFAQGSYQKGIGQDIYMSMSQATVSRCISEVNTALRNFYHTIKFPTTNEEITAVKEGFLNMTNGFPGTTGAIGCTHIAIVAPPVEHPQYPAILFLNRKGYYSLNVQIICDANLKILGINARYPGSVHDSAIWTTSVIRQQLMASHEAGNMNSWLLGDSGYPLEPWLMTPFTAGNLTESQARYNIAHKSTRNVIERLNGVFKGRFRCLLKHRALHYSPPKAGEIIYSCAVLHNLCIDRGEVDHNIELAIDDFPLPDQQHNYNNNLLNRGRNVRDRIVRNYF